MAQPVQADRLKARIAEQDLERPARCGIPFADDRKVGPNLIKHGLDSDLLLMHPSSRAGNSHRGESGTDQWLTRPISLRRSSIVSPLR